MKQYTHLIIDKYIYYFVNNNKNIASATMSYFEQVEKGEDYYVLRHILSKELKWVRKQVKKYLNLQDKDYYHSIFIQNWIKKYKMTLCFSEIDVSTNVLKSVLFIDKTTFNNPNNIQEDIMNHLQYKLNEDKTRIHLYSKASFKSLEVFEVDYTYN